MVHLFLPAVVLSCLSAPVTAAPQEPFRFQEGDRVCLLGGAIAERMQHDGWLEVRLQQHLPDLGLSFRNLGFGGDALSVHQRTMNFGKAPTDPMDLNIPARRFEPWDRYLTQCKADVVLAFFGYNESFDGEAGLETFRSDLKAFIDHVRGQTYNGHGAPRLVLLGSIPQEDLEDPNLPDGKQHNRRIAAYVAAMSAVAHEAGVPYVDLFEPMLDRYQREETTLTINGIHLTERGNDVLSEVIVAGLCDDYRGLLVDGPQQEQLRDLVREKNLLWFNHYRATDGFNVYGGRSRLVFNNSTGVGQAKWSNYEVLQREMAVLDAMAGQLDQRISSLVRGSAVPLETILAPPLIKVETNKPGPEDGGHYSFVSGEKALTLMTPADGMRVQLFASEEQFPELVNPVQMAWDTRGRLWVAVWPTYPHWIPGEPMSDKLLILEDLDGDGRADTCEAFADDLHNPTGFEFLGKGVVVGMAPDIVYLEDTDGDDRADHRIRLLHGLSSADTHHSANSFVLGPDGALYFQEGTFHMSQVESIYGPIRNRNGCVWRFDPRTWRVERYVPYNFANPHGHVFDAWGQDYVTDGTSNRNYYALAFNGYLPEPLKQPGIDTFFPQRSRPAAATEILSSGHFPEGNQGNYLIANVIGFRGIFQYEIIDDGSGFSAKEVQPIVYSSDPNFRPTDLEMGPDGALYFVDWHNPIIGHMQHHLRDPSRDAEHGRVYRVTYEGRELVEPAAIAGQPIPAVVRLLESQDDRVRYRARMELDGRDSQRVLAAAAEWLASLDASDGDNGHHLLEGLWLSQRQGSLDQDLLRRLLRHGDYRVRAAATRVLRYSNKEVPDRLALLQRQADDGHPRVRLEAVVAASAFDEAQAALIALRVLEQPMDRFLDHGLAQTMRALESQWRSALERGEMSSAVSPAGVAYLLDRMGPEVVASLPRLPSVLHAILSRGGMTSEQRREAAEDLAREENTTLASQVVGALLRTAKSTGAHRMHVLHDLGSMLLETVRAEQGPTREQLVSLAGMSDMPALSAVGLAALMTHDGSVEGAWQSASGSFSGLRCALLATGHLQDPELRAGLYKHIRPLMFSLPPGLLTGSEAYAGSGPKVSLYQPNPPTATLEAFAAAPVLEIVEGTTLALNQGLPREGDAFGLKFEASLFVPESGEYTFFVNSDDGSRLFLDGELLINNDGSHGPKEESGKRVLSRGSHPLILTYFDSGGGHSLSASWAGPGFKKTALPANVLASPSGPSLRPAAVMAMANVPGPAAQKFTDGARLVVESGLLTPTVEMLRAVPKDLRPAEGAHQFVAALAAHVGGLPSDDRTRPNVMAALEFGRELANSLGEDAEQLRQDLAGLGGSIFLVRTVPHAMVYDLEEFWVPAGEPVALLFQNNDVMPHNLVLTRPGAMRSVGQAAELLSGAEQGQTYVPDHEAVLWSTSLVLPGETERLAFEAPTEPGDYPFLCTFPGHWRVMNGVMHVVGSKDQVQASVRRAVSSEGAAAREFVRDWTVADLDEALNSGWRRGRSSERGARVFDEAGCAKCHVMGGAGGVGGPDLTEIGGKFLGAELLQQIIEPSNQILEGHGNHYLQLDDGTDVIGRVIKEDDTSYGILENLQEPDVVTVIEKDWIEAMRAETISPMPTGLLVTFDQDEILDLLHYLSGE